MCRLSGRGEAEPTARAPLFARSSLAIASGMRRILLPRAEEAFPSAADASLACVRTTRPLPVHPANRYGLMLHTLVPRPQEQTPTVEAFFRSATPSGVRSGNEGRPDGPAKGQRSSAGTIACPKQILSGPNA